MNIPTGDADKTAEKNEEGFDSFTNEWGAEDAALEDGASKGEEAEKSDEEAEEKPKKEGLSAAIHQKRRYREQLKNAQKRIEELEKKYDSKPQNDEEAREQQAREALRRLLREELDSLESEKTRAETEAEEELEAELEEVLESNPGFSEKEILDVCEELTVAPKTAIAILNREKRGKKTPPKLPQPRTGSPKSETATERKPKDFEEAGSLIKELLRKGKTY